MKATRPREASFRARRAGFLVVGRVSKSAVFENFIRKIGLTVFECVTLKT